jgi:hypothetical protein
MESISNLYVDEGTLNGDKTVTFPLRARYIEIINDSGNSDLRYKFNKSGDYATLKPLEAVTPRNKSYTVYLQGSGEYRVRGEG